MVYNYQDKYKLKIGEIITLNNVVAVATKKNKVILAINPYEIIWSQRPHSRTKSKTQNNNG